jgi:hypothetical protein
MTPAARLSAAIELVEVIDVQRMPVPAIAPRSPA